MDGSVHLPSDCADQLQTTRENLRSLARHRGTLSKELPLQPEPLASGYDETRGHPMLVMRAPVLCVAQAAGHTVVAGPELHVITRVPPGGRSAVPPATTAEDRSLSGIDHDLASTVEHALEVEGHRPRIHIQAWILHNLGIDTIAMRSRLEHNPGEYHGLTRLGRSAWILQRRCSPWMTAARGNLFGVFLALGFSGGPHSEPSPATHSQPRARR